MTTSGCPVAGRAVPDAIWWARDVAGATWWVSNAFAPLSLSDANVKTTHHRARRAMAAYDREQRPPLRGLATATRAVLDRFVAALASGNAGAVKELLAGAARAINDGGGEFRSGRVPVVGAARVACFYTKITAGRPVQSLDVQTLNGQPALVVELAPGGRVGQPAACCYSISTPRAGFARCTRYWRHGN